MFNKNIHLHLPLKIKSENNIVSNCFKFLTKDCVNIINDILDEDHIQKNCKFSSEIAPKVYRGLYQNNNFIKDLWDCKEITDQISKTMNNKLKIHPMLYERAHVNCTNIEKKEKHIFNWHFDSQPYVFVTLLNSENKNDYSTQYYLDGKYYNLEFPGPGYAYILKGSEVEHCVLPNIGKRTSMITSFVPESIYENDNTNLNISKTYTPKNELLLDFTRYKLNRIENMIKNNIDSEKTLKELDDLKNEIIF
tara:strand:- start:84 stop:833 length:750 start_codon:yes stop_codon:yes gene_type:complete